MNPLPILYLRKPLSSAELGRALEDIFTSREES